MPPKKTYSHDTISVSSSTSRIRSNLAADLITKSEAALSSQASIYTQRSQASQQSVMNFGMAEQQDLQFNREQLGEVFITRQQQQIIQRILQLARKGKVNSKNAFQIPIKVAHSEMNSSINNKFWKFASELLDASMFIYDKRVENMYVSIGAFQNKLSRIGFNIKDRKGQSNEKQDDVNADQQNRTNKNRQERIEMLKISANDFSGSLNLDDSEIIGYETLQKKDKLDIKNIENKFIADPTFERTQKLFDSYSLKSLMLNIFNLSPDLNIGLFLNSDLETNKGIDGKQCCMENIDSRDMNMFKKGKSGSENLKDDDVQIDRDTLSLMGQAHKAADDFQQLQQTQSNFQNRKNEIEDPSIAFGNASLSYDFQKHLSITHKIIKEKPMLQQITNFIIKQPELKQDYIERNNKRQNTHINQEFLLEESNNTNNPDVSYGEIIQRERMQFVELFKEFHDNIDEDNHGKSFFYDGNKGLQLFETHETQSQPFDQTESNFLTSFNNPVFQEQLQTNSMPVSMEESFFSWDEQNNIIEPIMPWQIQFKNLKLTKKRKKGEKGQSKNSKKQKQSSTSIVDFSPEILDRKQVLVQKDNKRKFQNSRSTSKHLKQMKLQPKQFDVVHAQYHMRNLNHSRSIFAQSQRQSFRKSGNISRQNNANNTASFVFDLNESVNPHSMIKQHNPGVSEQETRLFDGENSSNNQDMGMFHISCDTNSRGVSFYGNMMGVNNIREIKKIIVNEVNEKGRTSLEQINSLMINLSPQQLFTIFLHLANQHQFLIFNEEGDETTIILSLSQDRNANDNQSKGFMTKNRMRTDQIEI